MENIKEKLCAPSDSSGLSFVTLRTDEDRIKYTLKCMSHHNILPKVHHSPKNDKKSDELRMMANVIFSSTPVTNIKCIEALKLYTQSIAFAPCLSRQLAVSYANRSSVLQKLHKYEECIKDIDRALELPYLDHVKDNLRTRRAACVTSLQQQRLFNNIDKTKLRDELCPFKLRTQHSEIPCASDAVSVKYRHKYGRHLVAARDIQVGETIILEKAYSTILSDHNLHNHCSHCLKVCWANIPCNSCTYAMYCSEECRAKEWEKYHDVECAIYPSILNMNMSKVDLFALRVTIQAVRESSIDALRKELAEIDDHDDPRTKGFSKNGTFESDQYRSLYSAVTHTENRTIDYLAVKSIRSCYILYFLAICTNMFGTPLEQNWSLLLSNPDVTFFAGLLLKNEQILPINCYIYSELQETKFVERGQIAVPFCTFINHRCVPNIKRIIRNKEVAVIATYPIKSGEQIFDVYGIYYETSPKDARQSYLQKHFNFTCNCVACREDWPMNENCESYPVRDNDEKIMINQALMKLYYYGNKVISRNLADDPHMLYELFTIIKVLYNKVSLQYREIRTAIELLREIYDFQGDKFELPSL